MTLDDTAARFKALAHPARLRILHLLSQQETLCVCELMRVLDEGQSFVSRHLALLREAELVSAQKQGTWAHYRLTEQGRSLLKLAELDELNECRHDIRVLTHGQCQPCQ